MKFRIVLTVLVITLVVTVCTGCQDGRKTKQAVSDSKVSSVIIPEGATFPKQMVGVWENQQHGWVLRIEEDGRLSKLRHTIGRRDLAAGQRTEFPLIEGGKAFMQPGPWQVEYLPEADEIVIDISLDSFEFAVASGVVSGSSRDIFIGQVPQSGETVWNAAWISKPDYIASTEDKAYTDYQLPTEPGDEDRGEIVFEKIDPYKQHHEH